MNGDLRAVDSVYGDFSKSNGVKQKKKNLSN